MDWNRVDYLWIRFLSAVWTLVLTAPIHCRGSIGEQVINDKFLQICYDEEINSSISWSKFSANFNFGMNYSFKSTSKKSTSFSYNILQKCELQEGFSHIKKRMALEDL